MDVVAVLELLVGEEEAALKVSRKEEIYLDFVEDEVGVEEWEKSWGVHFELVPLHLLG